MPAYALIITEYDPAKPWVIVGTSRDSVETDTDPIEVARERWPAPRYDVKLDRGSLSAWNY